jgi:exodeoxyribonuclease-3
LDTYAPQSQQLNSIHYAEKVIFYQKLIERVQALISNNILPVITGDFNILQTPLNLFNPDSDTWRTNCTCLPVERSCFNRLLQLGYIDAFAHYFPDTKKHLVEHRKNYHARRGFRLDFFNTKHYLICNSQQFYQVPILAITHQYS